ncbi:MAG: PilZ domain-containing protein [Cohaesibacteraceae bacterium]
MMKSAIPYQGEERRSAFRRRSLVSATVVWDNRMSTFDVLIRNRSNDGFLLETENGPSIPNEFSLNIPGEPGELRCRVIWRSERSLGARIVTRAVAEKPVAVAATPVDPNQELRARLADRFPHLSKKR